MFLLLLLHAFFHRLFQPCLLYTSMLAALPEDDPFAALTANQYEEALADAREALANWDVPEEL